MKKKEEKKIEFSLQDLTTSLTRPSWAALLIASCKRVKESRRDNDTASSGGSPASLILLRNIVIERSIKWPSI